ncbi:hypothetical protein PVL29_018477 [Vitis rotundifolia]|uniref:NB-ARC domain-containing protein n=1 Tax=Vitis rotundifolia TaxID=103349 RepID=A0AA38Z543_VITRO|nr:hypothetical protein PVL29_018477 [Vitis rotundifolia]
MVEIVISIAAKVAEYLVASVGRQLGYLFHYNCNMAELRDQVEKLSEARMSEAQEFIEDEKKSKKSCFKGLCPNLILRYQLSSQAKKKALDVKKSQEGGDFQTISYQLPPPGAGSAALEGHDAFKSRNLTLEKIMERLRCDDVNMIGIYPGLNSRKNFKKELLKFNKKTADMLGFQFQGKDEPTRAVELKQRLKKEKILIILDDIWKEVDWEKVGIPSKDDQTKCKIVFASRNEALLRKDMGAQECFPIQHLSQEEAWQLYKKTAGDSVENNL